MTTRRTFWLYLFLFLSLFYLAPGIYLVRVIPKQNQVIPLEKSLVATSYLPFLRLAP